MSQCKNIAFSNAAVLQRHTLARMAAAGLWDALQRHLVAGQIQSDSGTVLEMRTSKDPDPELRQSHRPPLSV